MKFSLPILALLALSIISCNNGDDLPAPSFVYTDGFNISIAESWDGKLLLQMKSNKKLNCMNYGIGNTCTLSGGKVTLSIDGIDAPASCQSGDGEATDTPSLSGLAVGTYPLAITNEGKEIVGSLVVSSTLYTITYAGGNNVTFTTTTLNRLPANTLRGTVEYVYPSYSKPIVDTFVDDSLTYYGATNFTGPLVTYTSFTALAGNNYTSIYDPLITKSYRHFIYNFSGSKTDLTKIVNRYKKYGDTIKISMATDGQFFGTHDNNGIW